jgi:hypothetical protein
MNYADVRAIEAVASRNWCVVGLRGAYNVKIFETERNKRICKETKEKKLDVYFKYIVFCLSFKFWEQVDNRFGD